MEACDFAKEVQYLSNHTSRSKETKSAREREREREKFIQRISYLRAHDRYPLQTRRQAQASIPLHINRTASCNQRSERMEIRAMRVGGIPRKEGGGRDYSSFFLFFHPTFSCCRYFATLPCASFFFACFPLHRHCKCAAERYGRGVSPILSVPRS
ncbi:hypothetical protein L873DRAFT_1283602 [Choiromyces venosus 120613-1]|uniref:Uncharacterized protein n=1 Tax=Choiromyces venosus 120613-1 TaxID=1336337 RepID=A0A3N4JC88_9PEZI|nr:hypothetical protein L873DRAFT_1283602 [Choiromyces venosus 120613-1]